MEEADVSDAQKNNDCLVKYAVYVKNMCVSQK